MTVEELFSKLNAIPDDTPINQARRIAILVQINKIMENENV